MYLCKLKINKSLIMKKLFAIMVVLATIVAFASCNKNDDSLVGTSWETNIDVDIIGTIVFKTEADCDIVSTFKGDSEIQKGTYVYNAPKISITIPAEDITVSGTISGNKMTIVDGAETLVFTKK